MHTRLAMVFLLVMLSASFASCIDNVSIQMTQTASSDKSLNSISGKILDTCTSQALLSVSSDCEGNISIYPTSMEISPQIKYFSVYITPFPMRKCTINLTAIINNSVFYKTTPIYSFSQAKNGVCGDGVCSGNENNVICPDDCPSNSEAILNTMQQYDIQKNIYGLGAEVLSGLFSVILVLYLMFPTGSASGFKSAKKANPSIIIRKTIRRYV